MATTRPARLDTSDTAIFARLLQNGQRELSPALARYVLGLQLSEEDKARTHELAAKARAGTLTPDEQEAVESYSRAGSLLGVLKSKARVVLKKSAKTNGKHR